MENGTHLPDDLLSRPVHGRRLGGKTLGEALGDGPTLLVFLRHFGWSFCREWVQDLRRARRDLDGFPEVLAVHMGDDERAEAFFERFWPDLAAIADPGLELYAAFGLESAPMRVLASPRYLVAATRSALKVGVGRPHGDVMRNPGAFLVRAGTVVHSHPFQHFGDHPDPAEVLRWAQGSHQAP